MTPDDACSEQKKKKAFDKYFLVFNGSLPCGEIPLAAVLNKELLILCM